MKFLNKTRRHALIAAHDTFMAGLSFWCALFLRLGDDIHRQMDSKVLVVATLLCAFISLGVFWVMQLYRGLWRYTSTPDLVAITKSATVAILLFYLTMFLCNRLEGMPRSIPFIQWLLLLALLGAPRFLYRIWRDKTLGLSPTFNGENRIPVILIGAGDRAELFLRDTRSGVSAQYMVVGIVDNKVSRIGMSIHNVHIGSTEKLPELMEQLADKGLKPQKAILTYDTLEGSEVRHLLDITEKLGLPLARMPRLSEFKQGMEDRMQLRPIAVEDLLGRAQNIHDNTPVQKFISGKTVLVTGAGGTIGSELVHQIAAFVPAKLVLFELSEYALYQIDLEIRKRFPSMSCETIIGDVKNRKHLDAVFTRVKPDIVFHAAAIKHVPLAEDNPEETVLTNVFGTQAVAQACAQYGVMVMVMISTDKVVNPTSLMGATKRAAESYCQALGAENRSGGTRFVTVRFGNVLGSTGSVVPLFQKQLAEGGPLTVTHPDVTRYFMTVREAVELVLQAATLPERSGKIYVLDMGEPVKIVDLAEQMIRLAGLKPYKDIKIEFVGLRPGEKMFEKLFYSAEENSKTSHESIWLTDPRHASLADIECMLPALRDACEQLESSKVIEIIRKLVPEYVKPI